MKELQMPSSYAAIPAEEHHHQQDSVLEVCQGLEFLCGELLCRDLMQQLLKPAKGT